ncbi:MAG: efflux transporter outer membrane subunit [Thermoguttaceae bacterium]|nr:efflux transporter outer membrane subunit [Thermoguttaceae bacterium]
MKPSIFRGLALGALASLAICGGCKVGEDYRAPQATVNSSYLAMDESQGVRQQAGADVSSWWSQMQDPVLAQLTREAVSENLTLREAMYRVQSARAMLGATEAGAWPQVAETGGYTHGRSNGRSFSNFDWATSMNWELDFFGRLARQTEAATADMEALREMYRNAYVILCADVAQSYINARCFQEQIRISEENIQIQRQTLEIARAKTEAGSTSRIDESQALGVCRGTEANVLVLQTQYQATLNRLSVLLGKTPGYVDALLQDSAPIPAAPEEILVGIPADLLRRRPDIRAAEQQIVAQNARVGVAIGNLYPIVSLNGSFGLSGNSLTHMWDEEGITAAVGPSFSWNVLNFGKFRFNVQAQEFAREELIAAYREAVLEAAKDVDDCLGTYVNERDRLTTLDEAVNAYTDAYNLSNERYQSGQIDFQRLLDSQAGKLSYELQYVQCRASMANSVVQLYRALGGDWVSMEANGLASTSTVGYFSGAVAQTPNGGQRYTTLSNPEFVPADGQIVGPVVYASADENSDASPKKKYNPETEWAERQAKSRQRLQEDLATDPMTAPSVVGYEISPSPGLISRM